MRVVLRIGGSILFPDLSQTQDRIREYAETIKKVAKYTEKLVVVVGGGATARFYINLAGKYASSYVKDFLGIEAARLNARLMSEITAKTTDGLKIKRKIPRDAAQVAEDLDAYDILFCGGFRPGQSTTGVAAIVSEAIQADLLALATDVRGVYDKPPQEDDAKRFGEISVDHLIELLASGQAKAGTYELIDLPALKIIQRSTLMTIVFNGKISENIIEVVETFSRGHNERLKRLGTVITF